MVALLGFIMMFSFGFSTMAADFGLGPRPQAVLLSGQINVFCQPDRYSPGSRVANYECQGLYLFPGEYAYFHHQPKENVDHWQLTSHQEDGTVVKKSGAFDMTQKRSADTINLWINTLTQTALLSLDKNHIDYVLSKDGQNVESGTFDVTIPRGEDRACRLGTYVSRPAQDCQFPQQLCADYFWSQNYCQ